MKYKKSFSLLEILIVSAIIVLFSGVILASYNNFNQQKILESEVNKIVDVLSLAKSKALSGDIYFDCSGTDEFGGYTADIDSASYNFRQCCRDTTSKIQTVCGANVQSYDFLTNITNNSGFISVNFYPLAEGASESTIEIRNNLINKCATINIAQNGLITTSDIFVC